MTESGFESDQPDQQLDELVHLVDLDGLTRLIKARAAAADWDGLARVRRRCLAATRETGRQLWPAATLAEYQLALFAPPAWAASVLNDETGQFTIGPLSEVAAVHHTWADMAAVTEPTPTATFLAHERVIRGEVIDPTSVIDLPPVIEIPFGLADWEPGYPISVYTADAAIHPEPTRTMPTQTVATRPHADVIDDGDTYAAVRLLTQPWTVDSGGASECVCVEGDVLGALGALGHQSVQIAQISTDEALAEVAWVGASGGAHGRRRGMASGRFATWWLLGALGDLHDDWPPTDRAIEELLGDLVWFRWGTHQPEHGWRLQLAIHDRQEDLGWAINAVDR